MELTARLIKEAFERYLNDHIEEFDYVTLYNRILNVESISNEIRNEIYFILNLFFFKMQLEGNEPQRIIIFDFMKLLIDIFKDNKEFMMYILVHLTNLKTHHNSLYL